LIQKRFSFSFVKGGGFQTGIFLFVLGNFFLTVLSTVQITNLTLAGQTLIREVAKAKKQLQRLQVCLKVLS
jgi:hypothetical protein